eukprot:Nk52_evm4s314 gene=Nk52_evmTU4s314
MSSLKRDVNKQGWEDSEFPILCQTCLGDNPYLRMTREKFGKECKICSRPFTIFRWCPGAKMRFKKTEICSTCAKLKNVCQTCILDLEFGLPVQVRDQALGLKDEIPQSDVNREYFVQNMENQLAGQEGTISVYGSGAGSSSAQLADPRAEYMRKAQNASSDLLNKLRRTAPYYRRNQAHVCSFFLKGECNRGETCPFRHEIEGEVDNDGKGSGGVGGYKRDPALAKQNIKDRYYGKNDPVAEKMLKKSENMKSSGGNSKIPAYKLPPMDTSITTLYVGGLDQEGSVGEDDLREYFGQYGELKKVLVIAKQFCAFVTYASRTDAERCAEQVISGGEEVMLKGRKLRVMWGKAKKKKNPTAEN